jgi:S1-C subfamily serine protease
VLDVQAGTPAAEAGIELGDILTEVDGFRTDEPDELQRAIENSLGGTIIELVRGRMRGTVEVDLD